MLAGPAAAEERLVPARKVFPYLDAYLRIPAARRSRFGLGYVLVKDRPVGLWIVEGQQRTPIPVSADGRLLRMPTAAQWEGAQIALSGPAGAKYAVTLKLEALVSPAAEMDAATLSAAVAEAREGIRSAMGVAGLMAPKIDSVIFKGVAAGEAIYPDGRRAPLPIVNSAPAYPPAKLPGVRTLRFAKPPTVLLLS